MGGVHELYFSLLKINAIIIPPHDSLFADWHRADHMIGSSIHILTGRERYSEIYLARGSVDNSYLPEANGRGKIVVVLTPKGQIDFTIPRMRPVNICFIIPHLP